jgi:hypothetical protein
MRISVDPKSPDFNPNYQKVRVFLDGEEIQLCIFVDDEAGIVRRYKSDAAGRLVHMLGDAVIDELHGKVEIKWV